MPKPQKNNQPSAAADSKIAAYFKIEKIIAPVFVILPSTMLIIALFCVMILSSLDLAGGIKPKAVYVQESDVLVAEKEAVKAELVQEIINEKVPEAQANIRKGTYGQDDADYLLRPQKKAEEEAEKRLQEKKSK